MLRTFKITLPADTNNHNMFSLIVGKTGGVNGTNVGCYGAAQGGTDETGITGSIPTDGILPDRGIRLEIQADSANAGTITVNDSNFANTTGKVLSATDVFDTDSDFNSICFKDYFLKGSVNSQICEVRLEIA